MYTGPHIQRTINTSTETSVFMFVRQKYAAMFMFPMKSNNARHALKMCALVCREITDHVQIWEFFYDAFLELANIVNDMCMSPVKHCHSRRANH
jgi:hypothetical protein